MTGAGSVPPASGSVPPVAGSVPPASGPVPPVRPIAGPVPPVALYVHVPFCRSLCPYCDFVVYAGSTAVGPRSRIASFLVALRRELELRAAALDARFGPSGAAAEAAPAAADAAPAAVDAAPAARPPLRSLYLGGGTPSLLPAEAVAELTAVIGEGFGLAADAEVTLEANPGPTEIGDLAGFARAGVNRLSLGAQSLDDGELRRLGRRHRAADIGDAVAAAREAGIPAVSLDLLYDLPDQRLATWAATVEGALALAPDHVSCYSLTLDDPDEEGITGPDGDHLPTPAGARRWRDAARRAQDEDRAAAAYALADAALEGSGMPWYELSNWARPGAESRHNLAYWERRAYEAVGPGAHAFDGEVRRWNAARLDRWLAALLPAPGTPAELPPGTGERIDDPTAAAEEVILGLRTARGISRQAALQRPEVLAWAADAGLVEEAPGDRVRLTLRGRLLSNEVFARLL